MQLEILQRVKRQNYRVGNEPQYDLGLNSSGQLYFRSIFRDAVITLSQFKSFRMAKDSENNFYLVFTKASNDINYDYKINIDASNSKAWVSTPSSFCKLLNIPSDQRRRFRLIPKEEYGSSTFLLVDVTSEVAQLQPREAESLPITKEGANIEPEIMKPAAATSAHKLVETKVSSHLGASKFFSRLRIGKTSTYDLVPSN